MADKYHSDTRERTDTVVYAPGLLDTGDLETGIHTIAPTGRPPVAGAQYSRTLTLPGPGDSRLEVIRIAARLSVNIAGLGSATHVYCSVRVDADDTEHELFSLDWASAGTKLAAVDTHSGDKAAIFNLLKDGQSHAFYLLFWADAANQATIDLVQLWEAVGTNTTGWGAGVLRIEHAGFIRVGAFITRVGTGTPGFKLMAHTDVNLGSQIFTESNGNEHPMPPTHLVAESTYIRLTGTVTTDLNHVRAARLVLRSEP